MTEKQLSRLLVDNADLAVDAGLNRNEPLARQVPRPSRKNPTTIVLEGERPVSWNKFYSGMHWDKRNTEAKRVHEVVATAVLAAGLGRYGPYAVKVDMEVNVYFAKRPQDSSNIQGKMYQDGLIGLLLEDDDPAHVGRFTTESFIDAKRPRVEIRIIPRVNE